MTTVQFLTELDPNVRVKGSRDPLGILSVWSGFGRQVVGNLTTQTTSLTDFRMLVLGSWLVKEQAHPSWGFMAFEQICAYARLRNGDSAFRGVTRATRNMASARIEVSGDREHQILNNQAMYGVWGLYQAAAWRCGLLDRNDRALPLEVARMVNEIYLPALEPSWGKEALSLRRAVDRGTSLRPGTTADRAKLDSIFGCISGSLTEPERDLYWRFIAEGGPLDPEGDTKGDTARRREVGLRQRELVRLLVELPGETQRLRGVNRTDLYWLIENASQGLAGFLRRIVACESVIRPAAAIFSFVCTKDRTALAAVTAELREHYGDAATLMHAEELDLLERVWSEDSQLLRTVADAEGNGTDRWLDVARALHTKDFENLLRLLLQQNEAVSRDRGGARGWLTLGTNAHLQVHQVDRTYPQLPSSEDLLQGWSSPYFLPNLRALALETGSPA